MQREVEMDMIWSKRRCNNLMLTFFLFNFVVFLSKRHMFNAFFFPLQLYIYKTCRLVDVVYENWALFYWAQWSPNRCPLSSDRPISCFKWYKCFQNAFLYFIFLSYTLIKIRLGDLVVIYVTTVFKYSKIN